MTTLFSMEYFACHGNSGRYCFFSLLTCGATMGVFLSDSLFTLFLFFEIMGLTSFVKMCIRDSPVSLQLLAAGSPCQCHSRIQLCFVGAGSEGIYYPASQGLYADFGNGFDYPAANK